MTDTTINYEPQKKYEWRQIDRDDLFSKKTTIKSIIDHLSQYPPEARVELDTDYDYGITGSLILEWERDETPLETAQRIRNEEDAVQYEKDKAKERKKINEERDRMEYERLKKKYESFHQDG